MSKKKKIENPHVRSGRIIVRVNVTEMDRILKQKFIYGLNVPLSQWIREALSNYVPKKGKL